jgi:pSer/pThr/pTyr-binding forkhead associated (FHA) protein
MGYESFSKLVRICGACDHQNAFNAIRCEACGRSLTPTTRSISDSMPNSAPTQITTVGDRRKGTVSLYIQGRNLPVKVEGTTHIVLGRRSSPDDTFVTVDLSSAEAHRLGVSRHHAVVHLNDAYVTVQDLGSSNGTFVNQKRLQPGESRPLLSGDELRLGKMVVLFVYYFPPKNGK